MMSRTSDIPWTTVEDLFDELFASRPATAVLQAIKPIEHERPEVRAFLARFLTLMAVAKIGPEHISPSLAWGLGSMIPGLLPGAWGNIIPPFTLEDRHVAIDRYLSENPWTALPAHPTLLEMGCGFPPQTALDTARRFPSWRVLGADPRFDPYVLHDADGNYACMDADGQVRYFHPASPSLATYMALYKNPSQTFQSFQSLFTELVSHLPADNGELTSTTAPGARLVRHAIRGFEGANLTFVQAGIGAALARVDIIRVFNVLMYFDRSFRGAAEQWALDTLNPGGLFICGGDGAMTTEARYSVYQRCDDELVAREFAFTIDNIRPFTVNSWFSLHDGERETFLLARVVGILRDDDEFRAAFDRRLDALLAERGIWLRQDDGSLAAPPRQRPTSEWLAERLRITEQLRADGFTARAIAVLERAGLRAWENVVGHIAIDPATITF